MCMDKQVLLAKQQQASQQFDNLKKKEQDLTLQLEEVKTELTKLQGEYRAFSDLLQLVEDLETDVAAVKTTKEKTDAPTTKQ